MELVLFAHIRRYLQHTSEIFKTRIKQMPEVAEVARERGGAGADAYDRRLHRRAPLYRRRALHGRRHHGDGRARARAVVGLTADSGLANLTRWYGEVSARPSARA